MQWYCPICFFEKEDMAPATLHRKLSSLEATTVIYC